MPNLKVTLYIRIVTPEGKRKMCKPVNASRGRLKPLHAQGFGHQPDRILPALCTQIHACPVLGFQVDDVRSARSELESRGVEFVTDVFGDESEGWTYFRGPDSYVYELWQTPRVLKGLTAHSLKGAGQ